MVTTVAKRSGGQPSWLSVTPPWLLVWVDLWIWDLPFLTWTPVTAYCFSLCKFLECPLVTAILCFLKSLLQKLAVTYLCYVWFSNWLKCLWLKRFWNTKFACTWENLTMVLQPDFYISAWEVKEVRNQTFWEIFHLIVYPFVIIMAAHGMGFICKMSTLP